MTFIPALDVVASRSAEDAAAWKGVQEALSRIEGNVTLTATNQNLSIALGNLFNIYIGPDRPPDLAANATGFWRRTGGARDGLYWWAEGPTGGLAWHPVAAAQ